MNTSRCLLLTLALSLLLGLGCRPDAEDDGRLVIMRIGHAAPIVGFDAFVQVLSADAEAETASVGVRCDEDAQEVHVTTGIPNVWVCGLGIRLEEVHVDSMSGDERAVSIRVWGEAHREKLESQGDEETSEAPAAEAAESEEPAAEAPAAPTAASEETPPATAPVTDEAGAEEGAADGAVDAPSESSPPGEQAPNEGASEAPEAPAQP